MSHLTSLSKRDQITRKKSTTASSFLGTIAKRLEQRGQSINLTKPMNPVRLSPINPEDTSLTASN